MDQHSLLILLNNYLNDHCSEDEILTVKSWYQSLEGDGMVYLDENELQMIGERMLSQILGTLKEKGEI
ncbi:MAG: hypothetical protein JWR38_2960 [Mucilaginibacter sp.]|nr:hypothetical protein [Mucilaginibacter sp.]